MKQPMNPRRTGNRKKAEGQKKTAPKNVGRPAKPVPPAKSKSVPTPKSQTKHKPLTAKKKGLLERLVHKTVEGAVNKIASKPAPKSPVAESKPEAKSKDEEEE